ncbi:MAG: recombinase family protein [Anaeromicrobium sp.]|jgi:DNA invertase Pin-like site-specific DNA recombinase|uniref:recombinase family protein n=1 Tax=Anaeromicrobium sp. TaxID=1929132 RepID=UPI0025FE32A6|nr:recombinase family protein [Anaeromicrobium sp.]MCT4593689.1 recombinase family protein [Anaeromicrobium sp.]
MRVAVYARVSSDKEGQKDSIDYQKKFFDNYVREKGWEIYKYYEDTKTGTVENRKNYQLMLSDAQEGKFDIILAKELSRLARNQGLAMELKKLLENNSIHLITMDGAIDTLKGNTTMFGLYAWVYEQEVQRTSQRIKMTLKTRAKNGKHNGSAPYGYKKEDGKLIVSDDETADIVRRIFRGYLSGKGFDAIARGLYNDGIRTPSEVLGKSNASPLWHGSTVRKILENPHYTGCLDQNREETISAVNKNRIDNPLDKHSIVANTHEPIISKEDFETVKSLIASRRRKTEDGDKCSRPHQNVNLFTGLIYCDDCGKGYHFKKNRRGYICGQYDKHGSKACSAKLVIEDELIDIIRKDLKKLSKSLNNKDLLRTLNERISNNKIGIKKELKVLDSKIDKIEKFKSKALEKLINEDITREEYKLITQSKEKELDRLKERQIGIRAELDEEIDEVLLNRLKASIEEKIEFKVINREVLNRFVDKIVVADNGKIEIYYKFNGSEKIMKELMG